MIGKFADIDLHPDTVSNLEMGYLYEELIRRFSELSNETAGEHFTPREVIRLMVNLLFAEDDELLTEPGRRADPLRPRLRDRRHALGGRGPSPRAQPRGPARGLRPGAQRRDLRHLPLRHDVEGPGRLPHRLRQLLQRGRPRRARPSTTCSPIPPFGVEWKKVEQVIRDEQREARLPRVASGRAPPDQRR